MATKHNKGEIDWEAFLNSFDEAELLQLLKKRLDREGVDSILAVMSPKKRAELLQRLQADSNKAKHVATS